MAALLVSRHFGRRRALSRISFEASSGTITGLLGPNGAGKSTMIALLATLMRPSSGHIYYGAYEAHASGAALRRAIGILGHDLFLYPELTALENLRFFAGLYGAADARQSALAALEQAIARQDPAAAKAAHDAFHGLLLASARNPLLVAMFNQAQVARLSNISPEHKSFYDPRHLAHHRALLRALRKRDARAASAVVRRHFQSLGLMLEFVTRTRRKPPAQVLSLVPRARGAGR